MTMATANELVVAEALGSLKGRLEGIEAMIKAQTAQARSDAADAKVARAQLYKVTENQSAMISDIDRRLEKVEAAVLDMKPTVQEFTLWQSRVRAAGWTGRMLWAVGGAILALAAWIVTGLKGWLGLP